MDEMWDTGFEEILRSMLRHMPPDRPLRPDTDLSHEGLDSMGSVELLLMLEEHYRITVPDDMLQASTFATAGSLWRVVERIRAEEPSS